MWLLSTRVPGGLPVWQELILKCRKWHCHSFIHVGLSRSFVYPHKADILTEHISDIMTFVEPTTYTGWTYTYWQWNGQCNTSTWESQVVKGLIYLPVCACMQGKGRGSMHIYTVFCMPVFVKPICYPSNPLSSNPWSQWLWQLCQVRDVW